MKERAKTNTQKFEMVFKDLVPSNRVKKGDDLLGDGVDSGTVSASSRKSSNQKKYRSSKENQVFLN